MTGAPRTPLIDGSSPRRAHEPQLSRNGAWLVVALLALDSAAWEIISRTPLLESSTYSQPALRARAAITGTVLLATAAVLGFRWLRARARVRLYPFEVMLAALVPLAAMAAVVGLINGNQHIFIVGDTYRVLVSPIAAFVTVSLVRPGDTRRVVLAAVVLGVIAAIPRLAEYAQALVQGRSTYGLGAVSIVLLAYLFVALGEDDSTWRSGRRWALTAALIALVGTNILSLGKGEWLAVVVTVVVFSILYRRAAARVLVPLGVAAAVAAAGAVVMAPGVVDRVANEAEVRLSSFFRSDPQRDTISGDNREIEIRDAFAALQDSSAMAYLVGMGNGAEYPTSLSRTEPTSRPGHRHHIHVTFVNVLFRMGVLGLGIILALLALAARAAAGAVRASRHASRDERVVVHVIAIWLGVATVMLLISYGLLGDLHWGVFLGLLGVLLRERDTDESRGRSFIWARRHPVTRTR